MLVSAELGAALAESGGVRLDALAGLHWLGFARSDMRSRTFHSMSHPRTRDVPI
jgi:hypothetical protein